MCRSCTSNIRCIDISYLVTIYPKASYMRAVSFIFVMVAFLSFQLDAQRNALEKIIRQNKANFSDWADNPAAYDIQVLYTQIDRDAQGKPSFTTHRYGVDPNGYFYPASTVKMPVSLLALEKLNELDIVGLGKDTPMRNGAATSPQTTAETDASSPNLLPSVGHYVRKIFLTSDNDAFNRLYEFLGQRYLNDRLRTKGFTNSRIIHRLSVSGYDTLGNRFTNPVTFYNGDNILYRQGEVFSSWYSDFGLEGQVRGKAHMTNDGAIVNEPFDFSYKNYLSVQDLHDMIRAIIFPRSLPYQQRFNISADDYQWVYRAMAQFPRESDYPDYTGKEDHYVKFWIYGDQPPTDTIPANIRILNKVGWAYGYLTDAAYIVDMESGTEFILVGTIHVNDNATYNDGVYEYEERGLPFFSELGEAILDYEQRRPRRYKADFSWLKEALADPENE